MFSLGLEIGVHSSEVEQNCLAYVLLSRLLKEEGDDVWGVVSQKLSWCLQVLCFGLAVLSLELVDLGAIRETYFSYHLLQVLNADATFADYQKLVLDRGAFHLAWHSL